MERIEQGCWVFYLQDRKTLNLDKEKSGKWMFFYELKDMDFAEKICFNAVKNGIVNEAKYQFKKRRENEKEGVVCFYLNMDDMETHKKIIFYMMQNNLIRKTKLGKYYNISFKLNTQTQAGEYGNNYKSDVKLSNFINLETGEWLDD